MIGPATHTNKNNMTHGLFPDKGDANSLSIKGSAISKDIIDTRYPIKINDRKRSALGSDETSW